MASRRNRPADSASDEARGFAVVVEKMYGEFKVFGEALAGLTAQVKAGFEDVGRRFAEVDRRFGQIDKRFERVDQRFEQIDQRFEHVEQELAVVKHEVGLVKAVVLEHGRALKEIRAAVFATG
jgi:septal ring factor EnvC (AmiA/AmiB activator)